MEYVTELLATGNGYLDAAITFVSGIAAWLVAKFTWWKGLSKPLKAAVAVGVFLATAVTLSLLTALFN